MFYRKWKIKNVVVLDMWSATHLEVFLVKQGMLFLARLCFGHVQRHVHAIAPLIWQILIFCDWNPVDDLLWLFFFFFILFIPVSSTTSILFLTQQISVSYKTHTQLKPATKYQNQVQPPKTCQNQPKTPKINQNQPEPARTSQNYPKPAKPP